MLSYAADTMAVIDGMTGAVTKTVHLASHPQAIAVDAKTNRIYVANQRTADVTVFDGKTNAIVATVKTGTIPYAFAVDSEANRIYVANYGSDNVTVINGKTIR